MSKYCFLIGHSLKTIFFRTSLVPKNLHSTKVTKMSWQLGGQTMTFWTAKPLSGRLHINHKKFEPILLCVILLQEYRLMKHPARP